MIGGLIAATGEPDELRSRFPDAEETDHSDTVIAPGFRDAHMHLHAAAVSPLEIDAETIQSKDDLLSALREAARSTPPDGWVRALNYNDARLGGGRLTRQELDAMTGGVSDGTAIPAGAATRDLALRAPVLSGRLGIDPGQPRLRDRAMNRREATAPPGLDAEAADVRSLRLVKLPDLRRRD